MSKSILQQDATDIAKQNYVEYSRYVIKTRCYPNIRDGCKSVHRRSIYASYKHLPRHLVKSTNAIGEVVKYHPHPSSIYETLVGMSSKYSCAFPVFDTKGNFGDSVNPPAAERYTELMLSDLAIQIFCSFTDYADMVLGETDVNEPESLATLLPLCFLQGSYGIPTGMSVVNIPSLNPIDLIKYYIDVLEHKDLNYKSNVVVKPNVGNVLITNSKKEWVNILNTGEGSVKYKPVYEVSKDKRTVTIYGLPKGKEFSDVMNLFATEFEKEQIDIRDETTTDCQYTIEILPYQRINIKSICDKIEKKLTQNVKYKFIFSDGDNAVFASFSDVVRINLEYLIKCCNRKLNADLCNINSRLSVLNVIESLKNNNIKKLFDMSETEAVEYIVKTYKVTHEIAKSVMSKPISYLTREHKKEIDSLNMQLEQIKNNLSDVYGYLLLMYKDVLSIIRKKYSKIKMTDFEKVVK